MFARLVARERVGDVVAGERERGLEERDLDHVPLARLQRGEDPDRRPPRRGVVDQRHADPHGRAAGLARDREQAGERLHQRVVPGLVAERPRAIGVDAAVDTCGYVVRPQAEPFRCAGPKARDEHVGALREPEQLRAALGVLQVEHGRPLAGVHGEEHGRSPRARLVAVGALHLRHVGAERREQLRARGPGERRGQVDDVDSRKRLERHAGKGTTLGDRGRRHRVGSQQLTVALHDVCGVDEHEEREQAVQPVNPWAPRGPGRGEAGRSGPSRGRRARG